MLRVVRSFLPLFLILPVLGAARPEPARGPRPKDVIRGTATYRERVALTHDAVFEAKLLDIPRAGGSSQTLARIVKANPGQVPISFEIPYDTRQLEPRGTYVVRASITEGNWVRFSGESRYEQGRGRGAHVAIVMHAARRGDGRGDGHGDGHGHAESGLEDTRWVPIRIGERAVPASSGAREPWIELDSRSRRANGSGGCNRMSGSYETGDGRLRFGPIAATKMACVDMQTESAFFGALERTRRYHVAGRRLELMDGNGGSLATLEERDLR